MHSADHQELEKPGQVRIVGLLLILCTVMFSHVVLAMAFFGNAPAFLPRGETAIQDSARQDSARQDQLERLLIHDCGSCHGLTMAGGLGSPLTVSALRDKSSSYLFSTIKEGIPGTPMPGWAPLLSDEDIHWLVVRLLTGEEP